MVDRVTPYFGSLVRSTDVLQLQQDEMVGLGWLAQGTIGTSTVVDGFTLTPTTPASLSVILSPGQIYQLEPIEATIWSSLPANTGQSIVKQGLMQTQDVIGVTPPTQIGYSQIYLLEVQYADLDTNPILLPYYNAANPSQPFAGPANSGQSQATARLGIVSVQLKAGNAAPSGTQLPPAADAGWVGLFYVTVAYGQTTITVGNIAQVANAPFIQPGAKLSQLPTTSQNHSWTFAKDIGSASNLVINLTPPPTVYTQGMEVHVLAARSPNGPSVININGLGNRNIVHPDGSPTVVNEWLPGAMLDFQFDGTNFQLTSVPAPVTSTPPPSFLTVSYVITVQVIKKVHGPGADFADLVAAFSWVAQYTIAPTGLVVFQLQAGQFTYSQHVYCTHPNQDRIVILGAVMLNAMPLTLAGYTQTGNGSVQRASDTSLNLALLRTCFATELHFTGGTSLIVYGRMLYGMDAILFTGDGTIGTGIFPYGWGGAVFTCSGNIFSGFSSYISGLAFVGFGGYGLSVTEGANVHISTPIVCFGNANHGIYCTSTSTLTCTAAQLSFSNGGAGIAADTNSWMTSLQPNMVQYNASHGISGASAGFTLTNPKNANNNNGGWGVSVTGNQRSTLNHAFAGNASGPIQATFMSSVVATGATGVSSGCSPALGTVGNDNSLIAQT